VSNYSTDEINALLPIIRSLLLSGNDQWELVAELHSNQHEQLVCTAESIKRKFSSLANQQPGTGNPTLPPMVAMVKLIREAINVKAGVTDGCY